MYCPQTFRPHRAIAPGYGRSGPAAAQGRSSPPPRCRHSGPGHSDLDGPETPDVHGPGMPLFTGGCPNPHRGPFRLPVLPETDGSCRVRSVKEPWFGPRGLQWKENFTPLLQTEKRSIEIAPPAFDRLAWGPASPSRQPVGRLHATVGARLWSASEHRSSRGVGDPQHRPTRVGPWLGPRPAGSGDAAFCVWLPPSRSWPPGPTCSPTGRTAPAPDNPERHQFDRNCQGLFWFWIGARDRSADLPIGGLTGEKGPRT